MPRRGLQNLCLKCRAINVRDAYDCFSCGTVIDDDNGRRPSTTVLRPRGTAATPSRAPRAIAPAALIAAYSGGRREFRAFDLRKAALAKADLASADLSWSLFRDADLGGATLRNATLYAVDLRKADLRRADFRDCRLSCASLAEAKCAEADLRGATLDLADLRRADLDGCFVSHQALLRAELTLGARVTARTYEANAWEPWHLLELALRNFDIVVNGMPGAAIAAITDLPCELTVDSRGGGLDAGSLRAFLDRHGGDAAVDIDVPSQSAAPRIRGSAEQIIWVLGTVRAALATLDDPVARDLARGNRLKVRRANGEKVLVTSHTEDLSEPRRDALMELLISFADPDALTRLIATGPFGTRILAQVGQYPPLRRLARIAVDELHDANALQSAWFDRLRREWPFRGDDIARVQELFPHDRAP